MYLKIEIGTTEQIKVDLGKIFTNDVCFTISTKFSSFMLNSECWNINLAISIEVKLRMRVND